MKITKRVFLVLNIIIGFFLLFLTISSINEYNTLYSATWTIKTPVGNVIRWFGSEEKDSSLKTLSIVIIVVIALLSGMQLGNSIKKKRGFISICSPICDFFLSCCNMILCLNNEQLWSKLNGLGKNMIIFALIFGALLLIDLYITRVYNKKIDSDRVKENVAAQKKVEATVTPNSNIHNPTTNYNPTVEKPANSNSNDYNKNSFETNNNNNNNFNNNGFNNNYNNNNNSFSNNSNDYGYGNNQNYGQNNYGNNQQNNFYNQGNNNQPNPYMIGANDIVLNITVGPAGHQQTQRIILNTQNGYGAQQAYNSQNYIPEQPKTNSFKEEVDEEKEEALEDNNEFVSDEKSEIRPRRTFEYDDDDEEEDENSNQGRGMSVNSLLSPTKVNAPASRKHGLRDLIKTRSEGGISASRTEKDEAASSAAKDLSKNVDLSAFGINLDDIKTEEDYKLALEKILGTGSKKEEVVVEDEPEPDDNDLDYELYQIEDSDLNMDELRELKLIIGDPSNMTFIEKFENADEEIRKRYLKLRYKLLSSKEKRLTSRITRYFDSYYYKGKIVARITIQGKTIKLFLALDPKDYLNTKFSISDESNKLIYRNVPTLIRVRTDMSYEKGKRLISDMLNKKDSDLYEAPEIKFEEKVVDFDKVPEQEPVKEESVANEEVKQENTEVVSENVTQQESVANENEPSVNENEPSVKENTNEESLTNNSEENSQANEEKVEEATLNDESTDNEQSSQTEENNESMDTSSEDKKHYDDEYDNSDEDVVTKIRFTSRDTVQEATESSTSSDTKEFNIEYDEEGNEVLVDQDGKIIENSSDSELTEDENIEEDTSIDNSDEEESFDEEPGDDEFDNPEEVNDSDEDEGFSDESDSDDAESDEDDESDGDEDDEEDKVSSKPNPFANINRIPGTGESVKRKTFAEKIVESEQTTKDQYSQLKSLLISYGMKSRVAKSNETFRFKKQLFVKITVQGKSLKVFLALNPDDYVGTKFPIKDMSYKASYSEVPLLIKVRSNLSFKRAKILVEELMAKKGILQGIYTEINYAELLEIGLE